MKRILCYGDSNTWGYNPVTQDRFSKQERWTGSLSQALGNQYDIIEEGLNGRTTVWDDLLEGYKNGREYLIPCLDTSTIITSSVLDGIHFEQSKHAKLGHAVAIKVKEFIG